MTEQQIIDLFPELNEISNEQLKEKSIQALIAAAKKGGWTKETIDLVPVTLNWKGAPCNLR